MEDLRLLRGDVAVPLTGVSVDPVITFTGTYYEINGLGALTGTPGEYTLTLDTTGVFDELGDPVLGPRRVVWENRRMLATLGVPSAVQTTGVDSVPVTFSRAVSSELGVGNFRLVRDRVVSDVCGNAFCLAGQEVPLSVSVTGADADWRVSGLADETEGEGRYTLTLLDPNFPQLLASVDGVRVELPASASFVVDYGPPTVTFTPSTNPPTGAADVVSIRFSEPVNGFGLSDVTLTRDGEPVDISEAAGLDPEREMNIFNDSGVLTPQGSYVLTVAPGGITDQRAGRPFAGDTYRWTVNRAPTGAFGTLAPADAAAAGRTTPVRSVPVTFSEEVVGFDATDLALTRDGQPVTLTGVTVSGSNATYTVNGLGAVTALPGAYALSIRTGSGIRDLSFTDLAGTPSVTWTMQSLTASVRVGDAPAVTEGNPPTGGTLAFPITLDRAVTGDVQVTWQTTTAGTATAGTDFLARTGTAVIPSGTTTATVSVPVVADLADEPNETVQVRITAVTGRASLGTATTATGTITDDDPTPTVSVGDARITEGRRGQSTVRIPVTVATPGASSVSITWSTRDVTARAGSDYRARTAEVLRIPAGATSATISVPVLGDRTREPDETFEVVVTQIRRGAIADGTGVVTIVNDD